MKDLSSILPATGGRLAAAIAIAALVLAPACTNGADTTPTPDAADTTTPTDTTTAEDATPDGTTASGSVTFWTPHTTPPRLEAQEAIAADFTEETGIEVEVVALAGADQNQSLVTGAASGDVPDVILHSPDQTAAWVEQGLLDTEAPQQIVDQLGAETFGDQSLDLVTLNDELAAVPSDGWGHLVVYRRDLLNEAGLEPPTTVQEVAETAQALAGGGVSGIALGTQPGNPFTTETLESLLQPTGCELVTDGEVTIDAQACVEGLAAYQDMADSTTAGQFDVVSARAAYLAGNAGMLLFSSHILDELANLDPDNPPTCPECADNPTFLADNSGFVTVLNASNGGGRQYGATLNYGIPTGANVDAASQFIEYVMTDGYLDTLATATEGRVPLRNGTADNPTEYVDAWGQLPFGATPDSDLSISDVYGDEVVQSLIEGAQAVTRWGQGTPDAPLAGAVFNQFLLAQEVEPLLGGADPETVASQMADAVRNVQQELGG